MRGFHITKKYYLIIWLLLAGPWASVAVEIELGLRKQLFVDDWAVAEKSNVVRELGHHWRHHVTTRVPENDGVAASVWPLQQLRLGVELVPIPKQGDARRCDQRRVWPQSHGQAVPRGAAKV